MESRYRSKYESNGMTPYGNIKTEMLSDNENDGENVRFEQSSIDLSHCDSYYHQNWTNRFDRETINTQHEGRAMQWFEIG